MTAYHTGEWFSLLPHSQVAALMAGPGFLEHRFQQRLGTHRRLVSMGLNYPFSIPAQLVQLQKSVQSSPDTHYAW